MAKAAKAKSLVIVESPAKAKTINRYLGPDFEVRASMGHVRDLPSKGLNVDIENGFAPTYEITPGRKRTVTSLKAAAKKCTNLYLATDLDREGEAIAWHLAELLGIPQENTYRVVFNAITKNAIQQAFASPGKLDMDKVMAQQARRILDRIVGYQISPLLWKKVASGLSAGRVQSVAVKIVVEKELEIRKFEPVEYWLIPAVFSTDLQNDYSAQWQKFIEPGPDGKSPALAKQNNWLSERNAFKAKLNSAGGKKFDVSDGQTAEKIHSALKAAEFKVSNLTVKESAPQPGPPLITSTLQQICSNRLGFATKRTMRVAQQLYEGIDLGSMGALGLITYMRTDSTHLAPEAIKAAANYIGNNIGKDYLPPRPNIFSSKKSAQEAHEAIRPTDPDLTPNDIKSFLTEEQFKVYDLIWRRFIASQMTSARWNVTNIDIEAPTAVGPCIYKAAGRVLIFDGFTRIWPTKSDEPIIPALRQAQPLAAVDINAQQNFTKPPPRFTEASLVKALEKEGIGRPSTYASIISTIQDRKYVEQLERKFHATDIGIVVTEKLSQFFPTVMDVAFTSHMEEQLDKIEEQHLDWISVLNEFYGPFSKSLATALEEMKHAKAETTPSEYSCPTCKKPMVYRFGKSGKFLSCSAYPSCKYACPCDREGKMLKPELTEHKCPKCSKPMMSRMGRFGPFLGCSDYPECKTILNIDADGTILPPKPPPEPTGLKCYKCKTGELVIRQGKRGPFMGCNKFPRCKTIISIKQLDNLKRLQAEGTWPPDTFEKADEMLGRKKTAKKKTAKKKTAK